MYIVFKEGKRMKENRIKLVNKIYVIFLIILLILVMIISFKTGNQLYYLINTSLNSQDTQVESNIANWKFRVTIAY